MTAAARCDLFATDGERSAYRLGFQPSGEPRQRLDWVLTEAGAAAAPTPRPPRRAAIARLSKLRRHYRPAS